MTLSLAKLLVQLLPKAWFGCSCINTEWVQDQGADSGQDFQFNFHTVFRGFTEMVWFKFWFCSILFFSSSFFTDAITLSSSPFCYRPKSSWLIWQCAYQFLLHWSIPNHGTEVESWIWFTINMPSVFTQIHLEIKKEVEISLFSKILINESSLLILELLLGLIWIVANVWLCWKM